MSGSSLVASPELAELIVYISKSGESLPDESLGIVLSQILFIYAAQSGDLDAVKYIHENTAEENRPELMNSLLYIRVVNGFRCASNAALEAATTGQIDVLRFLASVGADFSVKEGVFGHTICHAAAFFGQLDCLRYLVEEVGINPFLLNGGNETAIANAIYQSIPMRVKHTDARFDCAAYLFAMLLNADEEQAKLWLGNRLVRESISSHFQQQPELLTNLKAAWKRLGHDDLADRLSTAEDCLYALALKICPEHHARLVPFFTKIQMAMSMRCSYPTSGSDPSLRVAEIKKMGLNHAALRKFAEGLPVTPEPVIDVSLKSAIKAFNGVSAERGLLPVCRELFLNNVGAPSDTAGSWQAHSHGFEQEVIDTLAKYFDMPDSQGYVTHGGTEANRAALWYHALGLENITKQKPAVFYSQAAHYSIKKAVTDRGLVDVEVRTLESGEIDLEALGAQLETFNLEHPACPVVLMLTAGTTETCAFDNVSACRVLLTKHLGETPFAIHLDGAFMGPFLPVMGMSAAEADSLSLSGHKSLGIEEPCGVVLARKEVMNAAFPSDRGVYYLGGGQDITVAGSRNGHVVLEIWDRMLKMEMDKGFAAFQILYDDATLTKSLVEQALKRFLPAEQFARVVSNPRGFKIVFPSNESAAAETLRDTYSLMPVEVEGKPFLGMECYNLNPHVVLACLKAYEVGQFWKPVPAGPSPTAFYEATSASVALPLEETKEVEPVAD